MTAEATIGNTVKCDDGEFLIIGFATIGKERYYVCDYTCSVNPVYSQKSMKVKEKDINNLIRFKTNSYDY